MTSHFNLSDILNSDITYENIIDKKKLQVTPEKIEKGRGGVLGSGLGSGLGGFAPGKNYSKVTIRR